ncbi:hypothetical protein HBI56_159430 [Parastagonospora nodorum]|uniref:Uncharacterized protein n=1 Tax=Phaeosphaeria nodorum (strain SN15 / ATCC MYA-4574 / FGSC 10173) TaxID=321614 RepID=A0A7U2HW13_PHANO|nr:hypothetical protein HBH56_190140 [Parastagonospora nodorum]QRC92384.1 hypothetical protein JI435_402380 [Parastagonospora nodorum SN15]KAH3925221.1 hypothetical protein HBH54_185950 [Parastagonospora nodorum]KAH3954028.1 hypothetical protein HBH53_025300 [Parastagonospora nodorum]KAH3963880.1 hypothetical protein HBH51_165130 [Parastagonospora nodorum]
MIHFRLLHQMCCRNDTNTPSCRLAIKNQIANPGISPMRCMGNRTPSSIVMCYSTDACIVIIRSSLS